MADHRTITLRDGRTLAYYEFGDPDGVPAIYSPGTPASGEAGLVYDDAARAEGVRLVCVDKPGYGHSDVDPRRSLPRYAEDVRELADALGLERFANVGESGGGPHALVLAYALGDRLTLNLVLAGMGPAHEAWVRDGMKPMNRVIFGAAQRAPWLLRPMMAAMGRAVRDDKRYAKFVERQLKVSPPPDREVFGRYGDLLRPSAIGAFRQGTRGAVQELRMIASPWGFELSEVRAPVLLWHGTEDVNVPIAVGRRVAQQLPNARLRVFEGAGHAVGMANQAEVMEAIRAAGERP